MLGMAVTLFLKNEKAIIAAAGVNALLDLYYFVHYFSLSDLLDFVAYASVVALLVFALKMMLFKRFGLSPVQQCFGDA